ncbi:glyoxalase/bleomycin resistance/extradiol dioxygenase family protein [Sphingobium lactosutens]|uniref:VOC family protein n=1 Tax=Sphingobium lactosutens TaxID=522773 RepID=UPI0015BED2AA|nr:VOC family protein [Sphingobium lactosutens]NWK98338.1 glyoxalase/bleomycin resistance/extradiol dioxygenase family protein [Sphingobium lactosutens]
MTAVNHVRKIDHVNIRTDQMEESAAFYQRLLGLHRTVPPGLTGIEVVWLCDSGGFPVIHLTEPLPGEKRFPPGDTGRLHHVAFDCHGHDAIKQTLADMGVPYEINVVASIGLRQIFAIDPNGVRVELNFTGD